jgi:hypothetical protein
VISDTAASARATAAITSTSNITVADGPPCTIALTTSPASIGVVTVSSAHQTDRDKCAQPAVMAPGEPPDAAEQLPVGNGAQVAAARVHPAMEGVPGYRFDAHRPHGETSTKVKVNQLPAFAAHDQARCPHGQ